MAQAGNTHCLQPEDDESPADEIAKALKAYLDHSEEGDLRYTSSVVSIVQAGDPRDPSMQSIRPDTEKVVQISFSKRFLLRRKNPKQAFKIIVAE